VKISMYVIASATYCSWA